MQYSLLRRGLVVKLGHLHMIIWISHLTNPLALHANHAGATGACTEGRGLYSS